MDSSAPRARAAACVVSPGGVGCVTASSSVAVSTMSGDSVLGWLTPLRRCRLVDLGGGMDSSAPSARAAACVVSPGGVGCGDISSMAVSGTPGDSGIGSLALLCRCRLVVLGGGVDSGAPVVS